jgi:hypothetical protein
MFFYHYSVLLPLFLVLVVLLTRYVVREPPFIRLTRFLNWLFLLFILADGIIWTIRAAGRYTPPISASTALPSVFARCDSCPRPDIYLLIFDEYAGSRTLRKTFHYNNDALDNFLASEDFHILRDSRSNYFITPFSMASMLNLSYLRGVPHPQALVSEDYINIFEPIRNNDVVNFLLSRGYSIVNYSPFDLPEHPSEAQQPFIATGTKLITFRTLTDCMVREVPVAGKLATFLSRLLPFGLKFEDPLTTNDHLNEFFLDRTMKISKSNVDRPRFVYMHVGIPHAPFLFDSLLRRRSGKGVNTFEPVLKDYLGYLPYTNMRVRQLITTIKKNTGGRAVILFMSDHGFRYWKDNTPDSVFFKNQNAVYFPDGDYSGFYDNMSNVNQFRVVFDKLFHLGLPLLKDSTILLLDKN